jgi:hypothetical protein
MFEFLLLGGVAQWHQEKHMNWFESRQGVKSWPFVPLNLKFNQPN